MDLLVWLEGDQFFLQLFCIQIWHCGHSLELSWGDPILIPSCYLVNSQLFSYRYSRYVVIQLFSWFRFFRIGFQPFCEPTFLPSYSLGGGWYWTPKNSWLSCLDFFKTVNFFSNQFNFCILIFLSAVWKMAFILVWGCSIKIGKFTTHIPPTTLPTPQQNSTYHPLPYL